MSPFGVGFAGGRRAVSHRGPVQSVGCAAVSTDCHVRPFQVGGVRDDLAPDDCSLEGERPILADVPANLEGGHVTATPIAGKSPRSAPGRRREASATAVQIAIRSISSTVTVSAVRS